MADPINKNNANAGASAPAIPTQDSQITGDLQASQQTPPQQPLQLQPSVTVPGAPGVAATSRNPHLHRFMSAVLGALAGPNAATYSTDASGKLVTLPAAPSTAGEKVARIARNALTGLSAGSQVGPQKSGLAGALSGLGAGAALVTGQISAEDRAAKEEARKDFDAEQQMILHKAELARGNALLYSTYKHLHDQDMDKNDEA